MVAKKRAGDFSNFDSEDNEIRLSDETITSMHEDNVEAMVRKRKQLKTTTTTTTTTLLPTPGSKMHWTKNNEHVILASIVDYEKETQLSYRSDWAAFYNYTKSNMDAIFSKKQLVDKVKSLKRKFTYNQGRSNDGKELSFTNADDNNVFRLSMIIWGQNETEFCGSTEKTDQEKQEGAVSIENDIGEKEKSKEKEDDDDDELCDKQDTLKSGISVQSLSNNGEKEKSEDNNVDDELCDKQDTLKSGISSQRLGNNGEKEKSEDNNVDDELCDKQDTLKSSISSQRLGNNGEKEKSNQEDAVDDDELGVLQETLQADTLFQTLGSCQQKFLLRNLETIGAEKRKELVNEWNALFAEELQLNIKKHIFSEKLANGGVSP